MIYRSYFQVPKQYPVKKLLIDAGGHNKNMVFLFPDTQIANETFLEEVSSVLNTGEVPNLYTNEDKMEIIWALLWSDIFTFSRTSKIEKNHVLPI